MSFCPGVCTQRDSHTHSQFSGPCRCGSSRHCCLRTHSGLQRETEGQQGGRRDWDKRKKKKLQKAFGQNTSVRSWTGRQSLQSLCVCAVLFILPVKIILPCQACLCTHQISIQRQETLSLRAVC